MPRLDGVAALPAILRAHPTARVVILTSDQDGTRTIDEIRAGAISYLLKTAGVDEVATAVRAAAGESRLAPSIARGRANKEIGRDLGITEETVNTHVASILSKPHLADRCQAAIYALQERLVPLGSVLDDRGE